MGLTFYLPILEDEAIDKNASILCKLLPTFRCGPSDRFHVDLCASGGCHVAVKCLIANNPDDNFVAPSGASFVGVERSSGPNASLDHFPAFTPLLSQWMKLKVFELGASAGVVNLNLIISK